MNSGTPRKRLHPYRNRPCYYCGKSDAISREHVPPKMMFANYECDHITVPACDEHNQAKSGTDEKILLAMAMIIEAGILDFPDHPILSKDVLLEYARLRELFNKAAPLAKRDVIWGEPRPEMKGEAVRIDSISTVESWVRHLTAGLVWSVTGEYDPSVNWDDAPAFDPNFYPLAPYTEEEALAQSIKYIEFKRVLDRLEWQRGWSPEGRAYPEEIYRFAVSFEGYEGLPGCNVIFKHVFYNGCMEWYVGFNAPKTMLNELRRGVSELKPSTQGPRKRLPTDEGPLILKVERNQGFSGWNRYPFAFVTTLKERLGDDFARLSRLAQTYRLFEQNFFKRPADAFGRAGFEADTLGFLVGSLGNQLALREVFDDAETAFNLSLKLKPEDNPVHGSLATLYNLQGKTEQAALHEAAVEQVFGSFFGNSDPAEVEERLLGETTQALVAVGMPLEESEDIARAIVEAAKRELVQQGHGDTFHLGGRGDYLFANQHDDTDIQTFLAARRKQGVTAHDIVQWHNLSLLEQQVLLKQDELLELSAYQLLREQGETEQEAATSVKQTHATYTHNAEEIDSDDQNDFLPVELKLRVNTYRNSRLLDDPHKFQLEVEQSSSFNAFIRKKFRL